MKEDDLKALRKTVDNLPARVEFIMHEEENDPFSQKVKEFAQDLSEISAGKIVLTTNKDDFELPGLPALTLANDSRRNIHYLVVPEGHELGPFSRALTFLAQGYAPVSDKTKTLLQNVIKPVAIMVLVSPYCTNCPHVVEAVINLASANPLISAFIADVQYFSELAEKHKIQSVPATIIDQHLVLLGQVTEEKLAEMLVQQEGLDYDRERIRSLIERGLIAEAADLICKGEGGEAALSLFEQGDLSMRMGVLVVFEEALEKDALSVRGVVPHLITLLSHEDARIRGDIADLLGKTGDPRAIAPMKRLATDPDPDVADAATDALELLRASEEG
jgi:hypothetical protein